jgi:predicted RNA-binding protein with TRAM domain
LFCRRYAFSGSSQRKKQFFQRPRRHPPKPVKLGYEYEVDINEVSKRGDGIARRERFIIFVPNAKVGDRLRVRITRVSTKIAEAEIVEKEENEN